MLTDLMMSASGVIIITPTKASNVPFCLFDNFSNILFFGAPGEIRTPDPQIRSLVLYPAEPPAHVELFISYSFINKLKSFFNKFINNWNYNNYTN